MMPVRRRAWEALLPPCAVALLLFLATTTVFAAIHEDEQGMRDWLMTLAGEVQHVAYSPLTPEFPVAYLGTKDGAVAALPLVHSQKFVWRHVLGSAVACVAASMHIAAAVDVNGTIYIFHPTTGTIQGSARLSLPEDAMVGDCQVADKSQLTIAASHGTTVLLYTMKSFEVGNPTAPVVFDVEGAVEAVKLAAKTLWVSSAVGVDEIDTETGARHHFAQGGKLLAGAADGRAMVALDSEITILRAGNVVNTVPCARCSGSFVAYHGVENTAGYAIVRYDATCGALSLVTDDGEVAIPFETDAVPTVLGASVLVNAPDPMLTMLVVSSNGNLVQLGDSRGTGVVLWERHEGLAMPLLTAIVPKNVGGDHFSFNHDAIVLSRYGYLYIFPVTESVPTIRVVCNVARPILELVGAHPLSEVHFKSMGQVGARTVAIIATTADHVVARIMVDLDLGTVLEAQRFDNPLIVGPQLTVHHNLSVTGNVKQVSNVFVVHKARGTVEGFEIDPSTQRATPLWTVRSPYPFIAVASASESALQTAVVNQLRVFPNKTSTVNEVRRKYPTRNVLVVAHYEPTVEELTTLVITAIDTITGGTLASTRHRNVEGSVHIVLVEHVVVYYFMDAERMRHIIGVWEMFEDEMAPVVSEDAAATLPMIISSFVFQSSRTFSSYTTRPPVVAAMTYGVLGGEIGSMSVTTSRSAIARKNIVLAFTSGRIAVLDLRMLLAREAYDPSKGPRGPQHQVSQIVIPGINFLSHRHLVGNPISVITQPTNLESSCHVLVSGLDLFYVRASSGKAFDLLNTDFNKSLLITITVSFCVLSLVARQLWKWKQLNQMWS